MTDKELRKLSRLELLELLLEASKENKKLKDEIDRLNTENETARNIENLSAITEKVEKALEYANGITDSLLAVQNKKSTANTDSKEIKEAVASDSPSDVEIYRRLLNFFANNNDKLDLLPSDIATDVRTRIKTILKKRK